MAAITRWDPMQDFASLRSNMDRLMEEAFGRMPTLALRGSEELRPVNLPIDVVENGAEVVVRAAVPGIDPEDVEIAVEDDVLTIRGETRGESSEGNDTYLRRELRHGAFQRMLRLPPTVDPEKASASFEHGILTLTLPKRPEARARSIKITPGGVIEARAEPNA